MDWKKWGFSVVAVFGILFVTGFILTLLATQFQCSKIDTAQSATEGAIFGGINAIFYAALTYFSFMRAPFSNTLSSFGIYPDKAEVVGVGYVIMLLSWILTVRLIYSSEDVVCKPDVKEMNEFKEKLMKELEEKQAAVEKNASVKINGLHSS